MDAQELYLKDGKASGKFFCGKCRIIRGTEFEAELCCSPKKCSNCEALMDRKESWSICKTCREQQRIDIEADRYAKANKLQREDWPGWIFCDGYGSNKGFFESIEEFEELLYDEELTSPDYVWCTTSEPPSQLNAEDLVQNLAEDMFEDAHEHFKGVEELQKALNVFNELNQGILSYDPDYNNCVMLRVDPENQITREERR